MKRYEADEVDIQILSELRKDSRITLRRLAETVNLSAPTARARLQNLEITGIIKRYTVIVDYERLGYPIQAFVLLQGVRRSIDHNELLACFETTPEIIHWYGLAGGKDYLLFLIADSSQALKEHLITLRELGATSTFVALDGTFGSGFPTKPRRPWEEEPPAGYRIDDEDQDHSEGDGSPR
ncbi:MAG: Lrp/AsnC family transcriptional regulator [Synergistales bacterium]|nr:Lrp/AsnC family transcriptional regulator [Synergistales bacterium]